MACDFCINNLDFLTCPNCGCSGGREHPDSYYEDSSWLTREEINNILNGDCDHHWSGNDE